LFQSFVIVLAPTWFQEFEIQFISEMVGFCTLWRLLESCNWVIPNELLKGLVGTLIQHYGHPGRN